MASKLLGFGNCSLFSHQRLLPCPIHSLLSFPPMGFLAWNPFSSVLASSAAADSSTRSLENSYSGLCNEFNCVVLLGGLFGSLGFSRSCRGLHWASRARGGCSYSGGRRLYAKCHTGHLSCESTFSPNADMAHVPTRSKFQNAQLAYIKQSNSRDVSEGFGDTAVLIT